MNELLLISPELIITVTSFIFLYVSSGKSDWKRDSQFALGSAVAAILLSLYTLNMEGELFFGTYRIDFFSQAFKLVLSIGLFLIVWLSRNITDLDERAGSEYFYFLFSAALGFLLLPSAVELISLFVALELSSVALYILIPLRKGDGTDAEAGIKYFLMSAAASAVFLYGSSFLYGFTQTTDLREMASVLMAGGLPPLCYVALVFAAVAFFFKLAVAPFHFWAPDVYQSANTQVTTLIATLSKVVAIAILLRFLPMGEGSATLITCLVVLSVLSMTLGNLAAIWQQDIKRLLAYSSIAQAGYMLIGFLAMSEAGYRAVFYYAATYLFANIAAFSVIIRVSKNGKNPTLNDFTGLSQRSPLLALALLLSLFSLAGIPPLVGFAAKWFVFTAAVQQGHIILVLYAFIMSVVSLYYYLMVIKRAYVDKPTGPVEALSLTWDERLVSIGLILFLILCGFFPGGILLIGQKVAENVF